MMGLHKREYIDKKYGIGKYAPQPKLTQSVLPPQNSSPSNNSKTIGGGNQIINVAPCVNEDFELTPVGQYTGVNSIQGWTIESIMPGLCSNTNVNNCAGKDCDNSTWTPGSPEVWIEQTPILNTSLNNNGTLGGLPVLGNSPLGGNRVIHIQDNQPNGMRTRISQSFPVTPANTVFQFAFAGQWQDAGHCCEQMPFLDIKLEVCGGSVLGCSSLSFQAYSNSCQTGSPSYTVGSGYSWTNWQVRYIDLTPYIGQCITLRVTNGDCTQSGHYGVLYFDAQCGGNAVCPTCVMTSTATNVQGQAVSYCAGSNVANIAAPSGYASYMWGPPPGGQPIPPGQCCVPVLTISPAPSPGAVYTVTMTSQSGCQFVTTNTVAYTTVGVAGIGASPSCSNGASGSATVVGSGSSLGYSYVWKNSLGTTVGTQSTATGLAPGIYSVTISGGLCGTTTETVEVGIGGFQMQTVLKPFCGNIAYIQPSIPGTQYKWYNNTTPVLPPVGTGSMLTVSPAVQNAVYHLSYTKQGCHDSIKFVLQQANPGAVAALNIGNACPNMTNGTSTLFIVPALNAPGGLNTFSVFSIGGTPAYNSSTGPQNSPYFFPQNMAAGTYSVFASDGSCLYGTTFNVPTLNYDFNIAPATHSFCSGTSKTMSITPIGILGSQISYSWTPPATAAHPAGYYLSISNPNSQQITMTPTTAAGVVSTYIYTITTKSLNGGCEVSKTATATSFNPLTPTLTAVPNLCNTSPHYTIQSNPSAGTSFSSAVANMVSQQGVITPANIVNFGAVTYTATQTSWTCSSNSSGTFNVSQFISSNLTSSISPLCVNSGTADLMSIVQNPGGSWFGTGVQPTGSGYAFNPANLTTNNYVLTYSTNSSPVATVCPSSTTLNVSVTQTLIPAIPTPTPFCDTFAQFTLTATPSGGMWFGTGVSVAGVVSPMTAMVPNVPVTYTVADGPCVNTGNITLSVSRFNTADLTGPIPDLCATGSNPFNLMSIASLTTGNWSGMAVDVNTNLFNPTGLPTDTYTLTYSNPSTPNANLCRDTRTTTVFVLNPPAADIIQPPTLCNSSPTLHLQVSPATGSWVTTQYLNAQGVFNPATAIIGNNMIQYATGTSTCSNLQSKFLTVEAFVSAATTTNSLGNKCNTGSMVNLTPIPYNSTGVWSGPGIVGSSFDPSLTGTGSFILTHQTASFPSGLCPDQATLSVQVFSLEAPALSKVGPLCTSGAALLLPVSPVGGAFTGVNTGAVSTSGLFNPALAKVGSNIVNYSITSGPCVAYAQTTVVIEEFVSADFANPKLTFCANENPVNLNSMVLNPGGAWSGSGVRGNMFVPSEAVLGIGNKVIYKTHSMPTASLCPDEKEIDIMVRPTPVLAATSDKAKGCAPLHINLSIETGSITSGDMFWYMGDGSQSHNGLGAEYTYNTPGVYHITYNYTDEYGCKAAPGELQHTIIVFEMPKADFSAPSEVLISNPEVLFTNMSSDLSSSSYSWSIPGVYQSTELNASVSFPAVGRYHVTLLATAAGGAGACYNSITKMVEVKSDFNVYIPNSFSPNFDRLNDVFIPVFSAYGEQVQNYEMEIFDRWGHLLFRSKDVSKGWDGTLKGEAVKEETYIYRIKFKAPDGSGFNQTGSFTLVR
ncbi:MAG: gliding motility-associated C-terminal domain-containing protein [Bacteroidetes bacterium]|nr:gliding motility-associated C-terminal domain-containing protein [Bacteroidota bacterium]